MDLKIEIRTLYALHRATIELHHGIRHDSRGSWTEYAPSQFVYAFFTFNSIYGFDWRTSFDRRSPCRWDGRREDDQFKEYLRYVSDALAPDGPRLFAEEFKKRLARADIPEVRRELSDVDLTNADKKLRNLARQLPAEAERLWAASVRPEDFYASCCVVLGFIYQVRCNLFHGSKTRVQLLDPGQQRRFLIYTSALIAANSLLFEVVPRADIGWEKVEVKFATPVPREGPRGGRPESDVS